MTTVSACIAICHKDACSKQITLRSDVLLHPPQPVDGIVGGAVPRYSTSSSSSSDASVKLTTVLITREPTTLAQGSGTESAHRATRLSTGA